MIQKFLNLPLDALMRMNSKSRKIKMCLELKFSLKEVFRDGLHENVKASEKIDFICILDNPKLIL